MRKCLTDEWIYDRDLSGLYKLRSLCIDHLSARLEYKHDGIPDSLFGSILLKAAVILSRSWYSCG